MAQYKSEYSNTSVNSSPCAYTQLGSYLGSNSPHHLNAGPSSGSMVVPQWGAIGYDALTHGGAAGSCNSYFNINHAYGYGAGNCHTKYTRRLCGGCDEPGSGTKYVCQKSGDGCTPVHKGTRYPPGTVYNTSEGCEKGCHDIGGGSHWVCEKSGKGCTEVHNGSLAPEGHLYNSRNGCEKGCKQGGGTGKGVEWVCEPSSKIGGAPHCVGVPHGAQKPPGNVYPTSYQCKENCNPVR